MIYICPMTLLIACFLIYGLKLHWSWYGVAVVLWLFKQTTRKTTVILTPKQKKNGDSPHEQKD